MYLQVETQAGRQYGLPMQPRPRQQQQPLLFRRAAATGGQQVVASPLVALG